jgi:hypothetical protein
MQVLLALALATSSGPSGQEVESGVPDWALAAASYEDGIAGALPITAEDDFAICSGIWSAWADAIFAGKVPDGSAGLFRSDASLIANAWFKRTPQNADSYDAADFAQDRAEQQLKLVLLGDGNATREYFGSLGVCHEPQPST